MESNLFKKLRSEDQPVHPIEINFAGPNDSIVTQYNLGLTKREYFAAAALQGLCANPELREVSYKAIASESLMVANYLIEELEADQQTEKTK